MKRSYSPTQQDSATASKKGATVTPTKSTSTPPQVENTTGSSTLTNVATEPRELFNPNSKTQHGEHTSNIVRLTMGNKEFVTTKSTLLEAPGASKFFQTMFRSDLPASYRLPDGNYLIDRDPTVFSFVLEYMRTGRCDIKNTTKEQQEKLFMDADYYEVSGLREFLTMELSKKQAYNWMCLSEADQTKLHNHHMALEKVEQEMESPIHSDQLVTPPFALIDRDYLVDLFPGENKQFILKDKIFQEPLSSPMSTVLFEKHAEYGRQLESRYKKPPPTFRAFKERLEAYIGPIGTNFPTSNAILAGGAVVQCLTGIGGEIFNIYDSDSDDDFESDTRVRDKKILQGDLDVFVITDNHTVAKSVHGQILTHLSEGRRYYGGASAKSMLVTRSNQAVTYITGYPNRNIQLILRMHNSITQCIGNFDVDCCQVAYDGRTVWATPLAVRALETGINFIDPHRKRAQGDFETRHVKYSERGFAVAVPGLHMDKVHNRYLRNQLFIKVGNKLHFFVPREPQDRRQHTPMDPTTQQDWEDMMCVGDKVPEGICTLVAYASLHPGMVLNHRSLHTYLHNQYHYSHIGACRQQAFSPTGNQNALVSFPNIAQREHRRTLNLRTLEQPSFSPHLSGEVMDFPGCYGGFSFPCRSDVRPLQMFRNLELHYSTPIEQQGMQPIHQGIGNQRSICYQFVTNWTIIRSPADLDIIEDAADQFQHWPFTEQEGRLRRKLTFVKPKKREEQENHWDAVTPYM